MDFLERGCRWHEGALYNRLTGRRVSAVIPVHILGHPVDLDPIIEIARKYNLKVIEDATEGLGATYRGRPLGSIGDVGCFSFNGNKIITTGGGGMLVTSNEEWARRAKYLTTQAKDDPTEYVHSEIGYNYRLTNLLGSHGLRSIGTVGSLYRDKAAHCDQVRRGVARPAGNFANEGSFMGVQFLVAVHRSGGQRRFWQRFTAVNAFAEFQKDSDQAALATDSSVWSAQRQKRNENANRRETLPASPQSPVFGRFKREGAE